MQYEPLVEDRDEIRLLTIRPAETSHNELASGRRFNDWKALAIQQWEWNASAVHLSPSDDPVICTLETVSVQDLSDDYRVYQSLGSSASSAWEYFSPDDSPPSNSVELAAWRGPGSTSIHPMDAVATLDWPVAYRPRYRWGDFEALSYTWGSDDRSGRIYINGSLVLVQKSVEDALRRYRCLPEIEHGMKIWIDAICINQADLVERSTQVKRMRDIYGKAWSVVVWLGSEADESNEAIDMMTGLAYLLVYSSDQLSEKYDTFKYSFQDLNWGSLFSLFRRQYFQRVWIVQELAMNHNFTFFICGDRAFHRLELEHAVNLCVRNHLNLQRLSMEGSDGLQLPLSGSATDLWNIYNHLHTLLFQAGNNIESTLSLSHQAKASNDRDKIYGIMGLLPSALSSIIRPDYEMSIEDVYIDFAAALLRVKGLEELLSWANGINEHIIPSWCPDWKTPFHRNHIQWLRKRRANGTAILQSHIDHSARNLACHGLRISTIAQLTVGPLEASDLTLANIQEPVLDRAETWPRVRTSSLLDALESTLTMEHPGHSETSPSILEIPWVQYQAGWDPDWIYPRQDDWSALCKVVNASRSYYEAFNKFRRANADFMIGGHELRYFFPEFWPETAFYSMKGGIGERSSDSSSAERVVHDMRLAAITLVGRKLFTTVSGHIGLAPAAAMGGDIVAILGCSYPVVLRPNGDRFRYVGECYVYGLMDGEAFDPHTAANYTREEFKIY